MPELLSIPDPARSRLLDECQRLRSLAEAVSHVTADLRAEHAVRPAIHARSSGRAPGVLGALETSVRHQYALARLVPELLAARSRLDLDLRVHLAERQTRAATRFVTTLFGDGVRADAARVLRLESEEPLEELDARARKVLDECAQRTGPDAPGLADGEEAQRVVHLAVTGLFVGRDVTELLVRTVRNGHVAGRPTRRAQYA